MAQSTTLGANWIKIGSGVLMLDLNTDIETYRYFLIYFYGFKGPQNGKWTLTETQNRFEYKCDKVR